MVVTCWDVLQAVYGGYLLRCVTSCIWWLPVQMCYKLYMVVTCWDVLQAVYGGYLLSCVTSCIWEMVATCWVVIQAVYGGYLLRCVTSCVWWLSVGLCKQAVNGGNLLSCVTCSIWWLPVELCYKLYMELQYWHMSIRYSSVLHIRLQRYHRNPPRKGKTYLDLDHLLSRTLLLSSLWRSQLEEQVLKYNQRKTIIIIQYLLSLFLKKLCRL